MKKKVLHRNTRLNGHQKGYFLFMSNSRVKKALTLSNRGDTFDVLGLSKGELLIKSRTTTKRVKFDLSLLGHRGNRAIFIYEEKGANSVLRIACGG